ncbi:hypothetical protein M434DRAFT_139996 [Hypoxylon sp. CO27-5]|nr:hypothetical protein M434DRAFT_139996 [Hypoxylon sp. CO27-5]
MRHEGETCVEAVMVNVPPCSPISLDAFVITQPSKTPLCDLLRPYIIYTCSLPPSIPPLIFPVVAFFC